LNDEFIFLTNKLEEEISISRISDMINEIYTFIHEKLLSSVKSASNKTSHLIRKNVIKVESWWTKQLKHLNSESRRYFSLYRQLKNEDYKIQADLL